MAHEELYMHGSMFLLLKKFIVKRYGMHVWQKANESAVKSGNKYNSENSYPLSEMVSIIRIASEQTGLTPYQFTEEFGAYLVPDLMKVYHVHSEWKTFELIENTQLVIHKALREKRTNVSLPRLNISPVHDKLIIVDYYSKRRMGSLAVGIIKGIANFYDESDKVVVIPKTAPDDERVQIRIEFR